MGALRDPLFGRGRNRIFAAAIVTAILGLPTGIDSIIEYAFGFACGLFIFQALFMRGMRAGPTSSRCACRLCRSGYR